MSADELKMMRAVALAKREQHDTYGLALLAVELLDELQDLHDHCVDQRVLDCDGIPGGCSACLLLAKANGTETPP